MYQFSIPAEDFEKNIPVVDDEGRITAPAKTPLPILDITTGLGAGFEASRCARCGIDSCSTGAGAKGSGCPFGRSIPEIHQEMSAAKDVLEASFKTLQKIAPDIAREVQEAASIPAIDQATANALLPRRVFAALKTVNPVLAEKNEELFDRHMKLAYQYSYANGHGPMGDIYGRICPSTLCKQTCTTEFSGHGAVTIPMNEAALWDYAWESGWVTPITPRKERPETVLIVGSGFAGYAAANFLRHKGYQVVIVEKNEAPGEPGNNQILNYKVMQGLFNRHYDRLRASGVRIECNTMVGRDGVALESLTKTFNAKAVVWTAGTPKPIDLELSGDAKDQAIFWNDATGGQQRLDRLQLSNGDIPSERNMRGKKVAIIGTGDTAVDCARTAITQGAREIVFISRRDQLKAEDEDALKLMRLEAAEHGISIVIQKGMSPESMSRTSEGGYILRGKNNAAEGGEIELQADVIIKALGSKPVNLREGFGIETLPVDEDGNIRGVPVPENIANKTPVLGVGAMYLGNKDGIDLFAAGDVVRGRGTLAAIAGRDGVDIVQMVDQALRDRPIFELEVEEGSGAPVLAL